MMRSWGRHTRGSSEGMGIIGRNLAKDRSDGGHGSSPLGVVRALWHGLRRRGFVSGFR